MMKNKRNERILLVMGGLFLILLLSLVNNKYIPVLESEGVLNPLVGKSFIHLFLIPVVTLFYYGFSKRKNPLKTVAFLTFTYSLALGFEFFMIRDIQLVYNLASLFIGGFITYLLVFFAEKRNKQTNVSRP